MLKKQALSIAVSLSKPSKMPCPGYGLPALESCPVGRKLAKIDGSTCGDCYACKGMYQFQNVKNAQAKRMESTNNPRWVDAMVTLIGNNSHFRWHDSGDLYSMEYLQKVLTVCARTPNTIHWIPTREKGLVSRYLKAGGYIPSNVTIRISAALIDKPAASTHGLPTSTVHDKHAPIGHACPAPKQNGECRDCRACWNKSIQNVSYNRH
jgi:hypothetical protein